MKKAQESQETQEFIKIQSVPQDGGRLTPSLNQPSQESINSKKNSQGSIRSKKHSQGSFNSRKEGVNTVRSKTLSQGRMSSLKEDTI